MSEDQITEKKMIIRLSKIIEKISDIVKLYKNVKYKSGRINKRKNSSTKESNLIDLLETPLNILKVGVLRSL